MLPPLGILEVKYLYTTAIPLFFTRIFNIAPFNIWLLYCHARDGRGRYLFSQLI